MGPVFRWMSLSLQSHGTFLHRIVTIQDSNWQRDADSVKKLRQTRTGGTRAKHLEKDVKKLIANARVKIKKFAAYQKSNMTRKTQSWQLSAAVSTCSSFGNLLEVLRTPEFRNLEN